MQLIRWIALLFLLFFSAYTLYAIKRESFWKSLKFVMALKWGRQVTMDLYIGLLLFHFFVYLNEGSVLATIAWLFPSLFLGNIVPLVYVVVNFSSIVAHF